MVLNLSKSVGTFQFTVFRKLSFSTHYHFLCALLDRIKENKGVKLKKSFTEQNVYTCTEVQKENVIK
jgi:hypothetical protein